MKPMMRTYPHLPLLTIAQCMWVFNSVEIPPTVLASLSGFTRMQIYRWTHGRSVRPHLATRELVSALAYRVLRAIRAKNVPDKNSPNLIREWGYAVSEDSYPTAMSTLQPEDLLPPHMLAGLNLVPREENAAA